MKIVFTLLRFSWHIMAIYNVSPQFHASNEWLKYEFEINKPISLSIRIFELCATP